MRWFAVGFIVFALIVGAAVAGRVTTAGPRHGDTPQQRDAVALVTSNVASAVSYYDLQWDDPPHVLSVAAEPNGDTVVLEEVRMATNSYGASSPTHMRFVLRGVVSAKDWLRSLKVIRQQHLRAKAA